MINKILGFFFLNLFLIMTSAAQNLVNNPGFEVFSSCPNNSSQLSFATGWNTSSLSPDYYDACAGTGSIAGVPENVCGYQQPHGGDGYIGLLCYGSFSNSYIGNFREFATGTLSAPLVVGTTYNVSVNVVLMNQSSHKIDHVGAKFTTTYNTTLGITNSAHVFSNVQLSDTMNWTTISGTFVADSAYNFIVIGNHFDDTITTITSVQPVTFGWNAYYFVDDVEVTEVNAAPVALFSADNHICPGTCVDFTNISTNASSYLWSFQGANPSSSTDVNPQSICYSVPGNYPVELIASNANGSDTLLLSNYITVFPYPPPQGITQIGDTLFENQGAVIYQWYFNGTVINGATNYFYIATQSGNYNLVATDENGCEVEAVINNVIAFENEISFSEEPGLNVFPNPVTEKLYIVHYKDLLTRFPSGLSLTDDQISIYNMLGKREPLVFNGSESNQPSTIDCRPLKPGMYILEITSGNKIFRTRIMRQ